MRNKLKLAFIENNATRRTTCNKRKKSLMQKIDELTTLCGINACAIVYSEFNPQPEVWPSPSEVQRMVTKFNSYSKYEQCTKMLNQESLLNHRILKAKEQVEKIEKNNREVETTLLMFQCLAKEKNIDNLNMNSLNNLEGLVNKRLEEVYRKIDELDNNDSTTHSQAEVAESMVANRHMFDLNIEATPDSPVV